MTVHYAASAPVRIDIKPADEQVSSMLPLWSETVLAGFMVLWMLWTLGGLIGSWLRTRRRRGRTAPAVVPDTPPLVVVVACKAETRASRDFFAALGRQDYPDFRVVLAVESPDDPAVRLLQTPGVAGRGSLAVGARAENSSQKVANVMAGFDQVGAADAIVVLADADAVPPVDWLRRLVRPLVAGEAQVVTGYRLLVPFRPRLSSSVTAALDLALASAPRVRPDRVLCWAGSTAARRETWAQAGFRQGLVGAFNDDLMVSELFRRAGLKVVVPRDILLPTYIDYGWKRLLNFGRRQYIQVRWYAPHYRAVARLCLPIPVLGWLATLAGLALGAPSRLPELAYVALGVGLVSDFGKAAIRQGLVFDIAGPAAARAWRGAALLTALAGLPLALLHLALGYAGLFGRHVIWAGWHYRIDGPHRVTVLSRSDLPP